MKLWKKSAIVSELASQKKAQIDEGINIARKVDALRETLLSLQKQESDFINGMKDRLNTELSELEQKVVNLRDEVEELETRKTKFVLLEEEYEQAKKIKTQLKSKLDKVEERDKILKDKVTRIKIREKELNEAYIKTKIDL